MSAGKKTDYREMSRCILAITKPIQKLLLSAFFWTISDIVFSNRNLLRDLRRKPIDWFLYDESTFLE